MDEPLDPGDIRNTRPADARPFVIALVGFVIVAVAAFFFLREDGDLRVVLPDSVSRIDDRTVRVEVSGLAPCSEIVRVQVDATEDDTVFVEAVVRDGDDTCGDAGPPGAVIAELPEPIGDRRVIPGVGRVHVPCGPDGECSADQ